MKVGDNVKILEGRFGYETGDIGQIKTIYYDGWYEVYVPERISTSVKAPNVVFPDNCLEKLHTAFPIPKLKEQLDSLLKNVYIKEIKKLRLLNLF